MPKRGRPKEPHKDSELITFRIRKDKDELLARFSDELWNGGILPKAVLGRLMCRMTMHFAEVNGSLDYDDFLRMLEVWKLAQAGEFDIESVDEVLQADFNTDLSDLDELDSLLGDLEASVADL